MRALFSPCGRYRYRLERSGEGPPITFVMLNPATADAERDDPTIRRVRALARGFGRGRVTVVNLYALRTPDPRALRAHPDPVGPENDAHLAHAAAAGGDIVCAWGNHADPARADAVLALFAATGARVHHLGTTKSGAPRHPLYVARSVTLTPYARSSTSA